MKKLFIITSFILALLFASFIGYSLDFSDKSYLNNKPEETKPQASTYDYKRHLYFSPEKNYVKYIGRSVYYNNILWFSMSGSGIEFITSSDKVDLTLLCDNIDSLNSTHRPRVAIFINGEEFYNDTLQQASETIFLDISKYVGDKVVTVLKLSESMYSSCGLSKIAVYDDKDIFPTEEKDLQIEFLGDSITAGYGLDEENDYASFSTSTENFCESFAYLAAKKLNADYSAVAFSGYGVLSGQGKTDCVVSRYYENAVTHKTFNSPLPLEKWDFSDESADVVVVNLGVNDVGYCYTQSRRVSFKNEYKKLIGLIRWHNKNAHILCVLGEVNNSMYPNIENAVKEYKEETGDNNVYCGTLDFEMRNFPPAIDGHPSEESHIVAGNNLSEMIQNILNGDFKSSYEVYETDLSENITTNDYLTDYH